MNENLQQLERAFCPRIDLPRGDDRRVRMNVVRCAAEMRNPRVATGVLGAVAEVEQIGFLQFLATGTVGAAGVDPETRRMHLKVSDPDDVGTTRHEFAHLVHLAHGYDVTVAGRRDTERKGDFYVYGSTLDDLLLGQHGNAPVDAAPDDPDIDALVARVNEAFSRIHMANIEKDGRAVTALGFGRSYSGANAAETFAVLHEKLQSDKDGEALTALRSARRHAGLLEAYFRVFNPTTFVARQLTPEEADAAR